MRDLEQDMAAALDGKFFWEHSREEDHPPPGEVAIKRAQEKFRDKKTVSVRAVTLEDIDQRVERITRMIRMAMDVTGQKNPAIVLRNIVAFCYNVDPNAIIPHTNNVEVAQAKHHYYWMLMRMNSGDSLSNIASIIGRSHSTMSRSREIFESQKHERLAEIDIVDRVVEAVGCGF